MKAEEIYTPCNRHGRGHTALQLEPKFYDHCHACLTATVKKLIEHLSTPTFTGVIPIEGLPTGDHRYDKTVPLTMNGKNVGTANVRQEADCLVIDGIIDGSLNVLSKDLLDHLSVYVSKDGVDVLPVD